LVQIVHTYCTFLSTLDYKILSNYLQLYRSYAIIKCEKLLASIILLLQRIRQRRDEVLVKPRPALEVAEAPLTKCLHCDVCQNCTVNLGNIYMFLRGF